jgi:hypothetical protein
MSLVGRGGGSQIACGVAKICGAAAEIYLAVSFQTVPRKSDLKLSGRHQTVRCFLFTPRGIFEIGQQ